jgi:hypothetical protein
VYICTEIDKIGVALRELENLGSERPGPKPRDLPAEPRPSGRAEDEATPGDGSASSASKRKKRKRLTFTEASNIVLEGIGQGPLRAVAKLEKAARQLLSRGQVELWNYLGEHENPNETEVFLSKVWRLNGDLVHSMLNVASKFALDRFSYEHYNVIEE